MPKHAPQKSRYHPEATYDCWYHGMGNTYGTWLPGDPKGFRTRDHREHVEGDYKNPPPPGKYAQRHRKAKEQRKRPPVELCPEARIVACTSMAEALLHHGIEIAELSVDAVHFHLLARFPPSLLRPAKIVVPRSPGIAIPGRRTSAIDDPPRHYLGIAKKESSRELTRRDLTPPGATWAVKSQIVPVETRGHYEYLQQTYIPDHAKHGAALWSRLRTQ